MELKKNIEIEIEKEFLTKYLESESEEEDDFEDDGEELDEDKILQTIEDVDNSWGENLGLFYLKNK